MKVFVLTHDHESVVLSMGPDRTVRGGGQADVTGVDATGVQVSERPDKARREILVEK